MAGPTGVPSVPNGDDGQFAVRQGRELPAWRSVLVVVAHPDDETFGLGAVIDAMTSAGSAVHVLCFTRGEASTLNERDADLPAARAEELRQASAELGVASCTLLDYPDGGLAAVPRPELEAQVTGLAARHGADGLLVFDDTGITGHRDHQAATAAAVSAGRPAGQVDIRVRVDRTRQRRAALLHASQISPAAVLWRRLQLQGDCEHLRWIR